MAEATLPPDAYAHSPAHYFIAAGDFLRLRRLLDSLPRLSHPSSILTESDSLLQSHLAEKVSSVIDRRDVPHRDSPLHLAVRLLPLSAATTAVSALTLAGADPSLPNSSGWTPLHLALSLRRRTLAVLLLRHHRLSAWSKLRRRLPFLLPALRRIPDFHLHISLRFESPLLPFIPRSAIPSDDVRLSKRESDLRADRRRRLSFLFLSNPDKPDLPFGSLLVLDRDRKEIRDAFDGADDEAEAEAMAADSTAYRPGVEIGNARLVPCTNWRRRERMETVGEWKTRVYELQNVVFSFKTLAASIAEEELPELRLDENAEEGFIVAELANVPARHSCYERGGFGRAEEVEVGRRRSVDAVVPERLGVGSCVLKSKEKEVVKNLKPMVWLTEDFPLKTEELLPMLDILANKIKVVKQLRELLTTKFPPGTFPVKAPEDFAAKGTLPHFFTIFFPFTSKFGFLSTVLPKILRSNNNQESSNNKLENQYGGIVPIIDATHSFLMVTMTLLLSVLTVAIPIVPTVRMIITFTKFTTLQPSEQFFTPLSSPRHLSAAEDEGHRKPESTTQKSWLKWSSSSATKPSVSRSKTVNPQADEDADPFIVPSDYKWASIRDKSHRMTASRSRKGKQKDVG